MQVLAVAAGLDGRHQDVLGRHERQLGGDVGLDHLRVDHQAVEDVQEDLQDAVDGQECLRNDEPPVGGIVQGPLEPLLGGRLGGLVARLRTSRARPVTRSQRIGLRL